MFEPASVCRIHPVVGACTALQVFAASYLLPPVWFGCSSSFGEAECRVPAPEVEDAFLLIIDKTSKIRRRRANSARRGRVDAYTGPRLPVCVGSGLQADPMIFLLPPPSPMNICCCFWEKLGKSCEQMYDTCTRGTMCVP